VITLRVLDLDVLDCAAEVIFLPIDGGTVPAAAGAALIDRSLGRIARAFARRYPDAELVEEIEAQVTFPLPLGRAAAVELPAGGRFRTALLLSTLAHQPERTGEQALLAAMSGAFGEALHICASLAATSAATPVLTGGWRLPAATVITAMLQAVAAARGGAFTLSICVLDDPAASAQARDLARSLGFG